MNRETAVDLLSNLLERVEASDEKTFLTSREISAIKILLGSTHQIAESIEKINESNDGPKSLLIWSNFDDAKISDDIMLCIDFGTSLSKAFACVDTGEAIPDIIDLPIGGFGGGTENKLTTPSEMIIDGEDIYFGGYARKFFNDSQASIERIIDSIKQYMTLGTDVENLAKIRVDIAKDTGQRFYQRDILLLYLSHLTRLADKALEEKGHSVDIRRRFAHPAWSDANRQKNQSEMKIMMAEAIVIARSLGDRLLEKLSIADARSALDEIKSFRDILPFALVADPVREATAAGAGALLNTPANRREVYIILDIGAGTTDVAGFYCVNNPAWDRPRVFEVASAANAIKSAGNVLDNALMKLLLSKSHLISDSAEYQAASASLSRSKRINKERLFEGGSILFELPTGDVVEVKLDEFLEYSPVVSFSAKVKELVNNAARSVVGDSDRITFVATGGGARLPILQKIIDDGVEYNGKQIILTLRDPAPQGMGEVYPDLVAPYPQIAVAVGGALPTLPDQKADIKEGITVPPTLVMSPMYKS